LARKAGPESGRSCSRARKRETACEPREPDPAPRRHQAPDQDHRERHADFGAGQAGSSEVQRRSEQGSDDEREDAPHPALDRREEKPRGNDERSVIQADHRVPEAREQALHEGLRQPSAHEVMSPGDARKQGECGRGDGECFHRFCRVYRQARGSAIRCAPRRVAAARTGR